tara:strand:+ start:40194 stop:40787 length:594 start_codon:yes stop_codon:yes gene_type:complete
MILKLYIYFLLVFISLSCFGQTLGYDKMRLSKLILKNGDTMNVIGKFKSKVFKYQKYKTSKSETIEYSKIESMKIAFGKDSIRTFRFFSLDNKDKIFPVEELVLGEKIDLYGVTKNFMTNSGEIRLQMSSIVYYMKKKSEIKLIKLGSYSPPFDNIEKKLRAIFINCNLILKKIENKEFIIRTDIEIMFEFYNKNCE